MKSRLNAEYPFIWDAISKISRPEAVLCALSAISKACELISDPGELAKKAIASELNSSTCGGGIAREAMAFSEQYDNEYFKKQKIVN